ncbi:MAG: hypothetical protein H7Y27_08155 [Gemmatimonadaceae bacterium]|nr:hypothetical protein [Chitinophagaceae bacterium]
MKKSIFSRVHQPFTSTDSAKKPINLNISVKGQQLSKRSSDEHLAYINSIAKEYPFCFYYKERNNDPL